MYTHTNRNDFNSWNVQINLNWIRNWADRDSKFYYYYAYLIMSVKKRSTFHAIGFQMMGDFCTTWLKFIRLLMLLCTHARILSHIYLFVQITVRLVSLSLSRYLYYTFTINISEFNYQPTKERAREGKCPNNTTAHCQKSNFPPTKKMNR